MTQVLVIVGDGPDGKFYWSGKDWTADPSKAKRYERLDQPLIVTYGDDFSLAGIGEFKVENLRFPGPKDWSPRRRKGS